MAEKLRWKIARQLDKIKRFCWADLVQWALNGRKSLPMEDGIRQFPSSRSCQLEGAQPGGSCYCGKFKDEAFFARLAAENPPTPVQSQFGPASVAKDGE